MELNLLNVVLGTGGLLISLLFSGLLYYARKDYKMLETKVAANENRIRDISSNVDKFTPNLKEELLLLKIELKERYVTIPVFQEAFGNKNDRLLIIEKEQSQMLRSLDRVCFKIDMLLTKLGEGTAEGAKNNEHA